jgi:chromosome segregation ATPase
MQKKGIRIEMAAKDDLLKTIVAAQKMVASATKLEAANNKLSGQYDALMAKMPVAANESSTMSKQMAAADAQIQKLLTKFNAQLKELGVPLSAVADIEPALNQLKSSDFYSLLKDLQFSGEYFGKIKK